MGTNLIKVDPTEFGIEENKAKEVKAMFDPLLSEMVALESEYNQMISTVGNPNNITEDICADAKALRGKYVKIRTATAKVHKKGKAFYLAGGRFIDGWKNAQLMASQGIEEKLDAIENHFINIEKEKIVKLQKQREVELAKYESEMTIATLGEMPSDVWERLLSGAKATHQAQIDAEVKAEKDLKEKEIAEAKEKKKLEDENAKLKKEKDEADVKAEVEKEARQKVEKEKADAEAKAKKEKDESEAKAKKQKEDDEAKVKKAEDDKAESDRKLKKIEDDKEADDLRAIQKIEDDAREAEENKQREAEEKAEKELNKGDTERVAELIEQILDVSRTDRNFESKTNLQMLKNVRILLDKVVEFIKERQG